jgi:hypothetical protein
MTMADPKKALEILEKYYATVTPERFKEDVRRATPRGESLHEEWGWIKLEKAKLPTTIGVKDGVPHERVFESLSFLIGNLPSVSLSPIMALGGEDDTSNYTGEMKSDVRVVQLSKLFDSEILETHLPWAGQTLHLVKSAGEPPESGTIYIGAVDTHEEVRNQHGVLRVILIAPDSKQMELHLRALRTSGIFEGECLTDDWSKYTLKASISDEDEFHRSTLSD